MTGTAPVAWVTGAHGFIGRHVARRFIATGWRVIGVDRIPPLETDPPAVTAEVGDTALSAALARSGPPQAVFHGAGNGSVGRSIADPAMCRRDTLDSTLRLLAFLGSHAPTCRVVFPSSAAVYGAAENAPLREDRACAPVSPYGEHKLAAERACLGSGQPVAILRMFSVYGPGLRKQLPWELGRRLLGEPGPIALFGTGDETRDFFSVHDAAEVIVALAGGNHPSPLIVNGGTGIATSVLQFAQMLAAALGVNQGVTFNGLARVGDPQFYCADTTRLRGLGFRPATTLTDGLRAYAAWLRSAERGL